MNKFVLKSSLSALLVALPLSGALADNVRGDLPDYLNVDRMHSSSIGYSVQDESDLRRLDTQIAAAQTNLNPGRDGFVNPAAAAEARKDLLDIRKAVAADAQANGGAISNADYQALSARLRALENTIEVATNG